MRIKLNGKKYKFKSEYFKREDELNVKLPSYSISHYGEVLYEGEWKDCRFFLNDRLGKSTIEICPSGIVKDGMSEIGKVNSHGCVDLVELSKFKRFKIRIHDYIFLRKIYLLSVFDKINLLNLGGVIGLSKDHNVLMGSATECELLGSVVGKLNKPLNLNDFMVVKKDLGSINKPLVAVLGTGIDSGKTTVTSFLIKSLSNYIDKISACKLAGTASQKDLYSYEDSGANKVFDFVDYGLPSTCLINHEQVIESSVSIVNEAVKENDIVFVELGDGYHGQYGTKEIIENKQISENIKIIVICAYDVSGAVNILENLNDSGFKDCLIIISGPVTNNITAFRESLSKFGPINSEYLNIYNSVNHANIFAKIINKVKSHD